MTLDSDVLDAINVSMRNLERRIQSLERAEPDAGFGAWNAWVPASVTQGVTVLTVSSLAGRWTRIGKTVILFTGQQILSAGTAGQVLTVNLPTTVPRNRWTVNNVGYNVFGSGIYYDPGTSWYGLFPYFPTGGRGIQFWPSDKLIANLVGVDPSFAAANGDSFQFWTMYETDE